MKNIVLHSAHALLLAGTALFSTLQGQNYQNDSYCSNDSWIGGEYLCWKIKNSPKPIDFVEAGSDVVLGGKEINNNWRSGGRFFLGCWLDEDHCLAAEANYLFLAEKTNLQTVSSSGLPGSANLVIPFFDVTIPGESSTDLALPGSFSGTGRLKISNRLQGAELNGLIPLTAESDMNLILLAGFRYLNFNEKLTFTTSSPFIDSSDVFETKDSFQAQNNFYGGQLGLTFNYACGCLSFDLNGKVALGAMCQRAIINGHLLTNDFDGFGAIERFAGGYFALPTNIGRHNRTRFSIVPEANIKLGYQWTNSLQFQIGYTFLYVSKVLWATKEVDRNINPTQSVAISNSPAAILVGEVQPKALVKSDSFWAQGLTAGINYSF